MPILMCPPTHFGVVYEINPWMHVASPSTPGGHGPVGGSARHLSGPRRRGRARRPRAGLPDMVFTANAGVVWVTGWCSADSGIRRGRGRSAPGASSSRTAACASSTPEASPSRVPGCPLRRRQPGLRVRLPERPGRNPPGRQGTRCRRGRAGAGRPRYYHLDTCFCALDAGTILFVPTAFSPASRERVRRLAGRVIEVPDGIAAGFACNAMAIGDVVVSSEAIEGLSDELRQAGYRVLGSAPWASS